MRLEELVRNTLDAERTADDEASPEGDDQAVSEDGRYWARTSDPQLVERAEALGGWRDGASYPRSKPFCRASLAHLTPHVVASPFRNFSAQVYQRPAASPHSGTRPRVTREMDEGPLPTAVLTVPAAIPEMNTATASDAVIEHREPQSPSLHFMSHSNELGARVALAFALADQSMLCLVLDSGGRARERLGIGGQVSRCATYANTCSCMATAALGLPKIWVDDVTDLSPHGAARMKSATGRHISRVRRLAP